MAYGLHCVMAVNDGKDVSTRREHDQEPTVKKTFSLAALLIAATTGTALADADYALTINAPSAKASAKGVAKIKVQPKGKYHINQDFPTKLIMAAPSGVRLEKTTLTAKDAVKFEDDKAEFDVEFTSDSAGKKSFNGELRFAVCEGENACVPKSTPISFTVDVK
jgi:hypothetical protein